MVYVIRILNIVSIYIFTPLNNNDNNNDFFQIFPYELYNLQKKFKNLFFSFLLSYLFAIKTEVTYYNFSRVADSYILQLVRNICYWDHKYTCYYNK